MQPHGSSIETEQQKRERSNSAHRTSVRIDHTLSLLHIKTRIMAVATQSLEELCINSIRFLAIDAVEKAKSGHPGLPMGAAPMAFVLWDRFMRFNPKNPKWFNRDRFRPLRWPRLYAAVRPPVLDRLR